jgi:DNA-binding transcriptional ArsR family regulator
MSSFDPNDAAIETWTEETDGFDRVEAVVSRTGEPQSAAEIAESAHVSESTARKHLDRLADLGLALATQEGRVIRYERDDDHYLLERVRDLQRGQTHEKLVESIEEMEAEIEEYRREYGVEAPEDLALAEKSAEGSADPWGALTDWSTTREHLAIARTALAYKRASVLANA